MVKSKPALDATFGALADPIRRAVLSRLTRGPTTVTELAHPHPVSLPGFLKHLRILEAAGLIASAKRGRVRHCRLRPKPLADAEHWIGRHRVFWERQLDSLARFLESPQQQENAPWPPPPPPLRSRSAAGSLPPGRKSIKRGPTRP